MGKGAQRAARACSCTASRRLRAGRVRLVGQTLVVALGVALCVAWSRPAQAVPRGCTSAFGVALETYGYTWVVIDRGSIDDASIVDATLALRAGEFSTADIVVNFAEPRMHVDAEFLSFERERRLVRRARAEHADFRDASCALLGLVIDTLAERRRDRMIYMWVALGCGLLSFGAWRLSLRAR